MTFLRETRFTQAGILAILVIPHQAEVTGEDGVVADADFAIAVEVG
jgi:hypothetical protein